MADFLVGHVMATAGVLGATGKIRMTSPYKEMVGALQSALARAGHNIAVVTRQLGGSIAGVHFGYDSTQGFDPVAEAVAGCYDTVSLGQTVSANGWRDYQAIVNRAVERRAEVAADTGSYVGIIATKVNKNFFNFFFF